MEDGLVLESPRGRDNGLEGRGRGESSLGVRGVSEGEEVGFVGDCGGGSVEDGLGLS